MATATVETLTDYLLMNSTAIKLKCLCLLGWLKTLELAIKLEPENTDGDGGDDNNMMASTKCVSISPPSHDVDEKVSICVFGATPHPLGTQSPPPLVPTCSLDESLTSPRTGAWYQWGWSLGTKAGGVSRGWCRSQFTETRKWTQICLHHFWSNFNMFFHHLMQKYKCQFDSKMFHRRSARKHQQNDDLHKEFKNSEWISLRLLLTPTRWAPTHAHD